MIPRRKSVRYDGTANITRRIEVSGVPGLEQHARIAVLHFEASTVLVNLAAVESIRVVEPNFSQPGFAPQHGRRVVIGMRSGAWHEVEFEQPEHDEDTASQIAQVDALLLAWQTVAGAR